MKKSIIIALAITISSLSIQAQQANAVMNQADIKNMETDSVGVATKTPLKASQNLRAEITVQEKLELLNVLNTGKAVLLKSANSIYTIEQNLSLLKDFEAVVNFLDQRFKEVTKPNASQSDKAYTEKSKQDLESLKKAKAVIMEKFLMQFLGTTDTMLFLIAFIYALLGLFISLGVSVKNRDKGSIATPRQFCLKFFLMDNAERIGKNAAILFAMCRFYTEIYNNPITTWKAFVLGLAFDRAYAVLKTFTKKARA